MCFETVSGYCMVSELALMTSLRIPILMGTAVYNDGLLMMSPISRELLNVYNPIVRAYLHLTLLSTKYKISE